MRRKSPLLLSFLVLASCATSHVPQAIRKGPVQPLYVDEVQQAPERFLGQRLRWGGNIISVRNRKRATEIEILSRPLDADGKPRDKEPGEGRFIALLEGFADPAEYPEKRLLTVTGHLMRVETRPVGEYPYPFPLVRVASRYLWPKPLPRRAPRYYYDPWYYPWYRPWHSCCGPWY